MLRDQGFGDVMPNGELFDALTDVKAKFMAECGKTGKPMRVMQPIDNAVVAEGAGKLLTAVFPFNDVVDQASAYNLN